MRDYLNVDWLRANHTMVHYFGLGFIQLKLDDMERMHFYIPGLEPTVPMEDVHNHRYNFTSRILKGTLTQYLYTVRQDVVGHHELEDVTCAEGETPYQHPGVYWVTQDSSHTYAAGSSYFISHAQFHKVKPRGLCITLLDRSLHRKDRAQVARSIGTQPVCPFGKKIPEPELWEHIAEALR